MHYGHDTDSDQGQNNLSIIGFAVHDAELSYLPMSSQVTDFDHNY